VASTGTSPLPRAAAVSARLTVYRKAVAKPGSSLMGQPYAAGSPLGRPHPQASIEVGRAIQASGAVIPVTVKAVTNGTDKARMR
jgi:hypothetical protein